MLYKHGVEDCDFVAYGTGREVVSELIRHAEIPLFQEATDEVHVHAWLLEIEQDPSSFQQEIQGLGQEVVRFVVGRRSSVFRGGEVSVEAESVVLTAVLAVGFDD